MTYYMEQDEELLRSHSAMNVRKLEIYIQKRSCNEREIT